MIYLKIVLNRFKLHLNNTEACKIAQKVMDYYKTENLDDSYHFESMYWIREGMDFMIDFNFIPIVASKLLDNSNNNDCKES